MILENTFMGQDKKSSAQAFYGFMEYKKIIFGNSAENSCQCCVKLSVVLL